MWATRCIFFFFCFCSSNRVRSRVLTDCVLFSFVPSCRRVYALADEPIWSNVRDMCTENGWRTGHENVLKTVTALRTSIFLFFLLLLSFPGTFQRKPSCENRDTRRPGRCHAQLYRRRVHVAPSSRPRGSHTASFTRRPATPWTLFRYLKKKKMYLTLTRVTS